MTSATLQSYIEKKSFEEVGGLSEERRYAYRGDLTLLRTFKKLGPIESVLSSLVRSQKSLATHSFMGRAIRVGPRQLPRIHRLAKECADVLQIPLADVYVVNSPVMNAYTFGTNDDSFVVLHSKLIDDFSDEELKFVIGHEMGHIQNKHVVYGTALRLLRANIGVFLRWLAPPAEAALAAWSRRAEITCDRAGLLCAGELSVAEQSFLKMACGSQKLYDELNIDAFLEQLESGTTTVGRLTEMFASHPYLPKRIRALQIFEQSALFRQHVGAAEDREAEDTAGLSMTEVDDQVDKVVRLVASSA